MVIAFGNFYMYSCNLGIKEGLFFAIWFITHLQCTEK